MGERLTDQDLDMMLDWLRSGATCPLTASESDRLALAIVELRGYRIEGALPIGMDVVKARGYGFPGEVRAAFTNRAGDLRYVVEATGNGYSGMLHIFAPDQVAQAPTCPFCKTPHAGPLPCRHCGEPDMPEQGD